MAIVLTWAASVAHPADPSPRWKFSERHMGTLFQVTIEHPDEATARRAATAAFARAKGLDQKLSDYQPQSELMRLCAQPPGVPTPVSDDLLAVVRQGQDLARRSDGAFDITIGPVVRLWRLARRTRELPTPSDRAAAMAKVGHRKLTLDPSLKTITLTEAGMRLDLGGIAKGYAGDCMVAAMRDAGCPRCLVAAGGDVVAGDPPTGETGWHVAIHPLADGDDPAPLLLANSAASTCGDAEQFVEIAGTRYSHVLDPRTGLGLTERRSVTVVAPRGLLADGLDTAIAVLGPEAGGKLIRETPGTRCRFARLIGDRVDVTTIP